MANVEGILLVEFEVVEELFPNLFVFGDGLEEGEGLELPPVA